MGASLLGAKFVRGRVCQGPSLLGAEMSRNRFQLSDRSAGHAGEGLHPYGIGL